MSIIESLPPRPAADWRALQAVDAYRLLVASGLVLCIAAGWQQLVFGPALYTGFGSTSVAYFGAAVVALAASFARRPSVARHLVAATLIDIVALCGLALITEGVASGLGLLLLLPIAASGLMLGWRMAAFLAACSALALLGQEALRPVLADGATPDFFQAGLTGVYYFLAAGAAQWVGRRLNATQDIALLSASRARRFRDLNERIIEHIETGAMVVDSDRYIRTLNTAACQLLDVKRDTAENHSLDYVAPSLSAHLSDWLVGGKLPDSVLSVDDRPMFPTFSKLRTREGTDILISLQDADRQSEQAQQLKLASLGRLTASVAHEVRNPLGAISHAAQLVSESDRLGTGDKRLFTIIDRHVRRIDDITASMLGLAQKSQANRERIALADWLADATAEYAELHEDAPVFELASVSPEARTEFDPAHLRQILINLWDNARRYARVEDRVLRVTLATRRGYDNRMVLDIVDNGPGIDTEAAANVLEPFFTTSGNGTGLGLHIARELCAANGARLLPLSSHSGACFTLMFDKRRAYSAADESSQAASA